jgi:uncharacterized protein YpuA (DUF1002 family)
MDDNKYKKNPSLKETLDKITFKNNEIAKISALQNENARLKDQIGRRKSGSRQVSSAKIQGLQSLRANLGGQFNK